MTESPTNRGRMASFSPRIFSISKKNERKAESDSPGGRNFEEDNGPLIKEGILEKKSGTVLKGWSKQQIRLYQEALMWSESKQWNPKEKQEIKLLTILSVTGPGEGKEKGKQFTIEVLGNQQHLFKGTTEVEAKEWAKAVRDVLDQMRAELAPPAAEAKPEDSMEEAKQEETKLTTSAEEELLKAKAEGKPNPAISVTNVQGQANVPTLAIPKSAAQPAVTGNVQNVSRDSSPDKSGSSPAKSITPPKSAEVSPKRGRTSDHSEGNSRSGTPTPPGGVTPPQPTSHDQGRGSIMSVRSASAWKSNSTIMHDPGILLREGVLEKKSTSMLKGWRKMHFRLYTEGLMYSDGKKWDPRLLAKVIDITKVTHPGESKHVTKKMIGIDVTIHGAKTTQDHIVLKASSEDEAKLWSKSIQDRLDELNAGPDPEVVKREIELHEASRKLEQEAKRREKEEQEAQQKALEAQEAEAKRKQEDAEAAIRKGLQEEEIRNGNRSWVNQAEPLGKPAEATTVVQMSIENVDFQKLDHTAKDDLELGLRRTIAKNASVSEDRVSVTLQPGSVKVIAKINAPQGQTMRIDKGSLEKDVLQTAKSIDSVRKAAVGELHVTPPTIHEEAPVAMEEKLSLEQKMEQRKKLVDGETGVPPEPGDEFWKTFVNDPSLQSSPVKSSVSDEETRKALERRKSVEAMATDAGIDQLDIQKHSQGDLAQMVVDNTIGEIQDRQALMTSLPPGSRQVSEIAKEIGRLDERRRSATEIAQSQSGQGDGLGVTASRKKAIEMTAAECMQQIQKLQAELKNLPPTSERAQAIQQEITTLNQRRAAAESVAVQVAAEEKIEEQKAGSARRRAIESTAAMTVQLCSEKIARLQSETKSLSPGDARYKTCMAEISALEKEQGSAELILLAAQAGVANPESPMRSQAQLAFEIVSATQQQTNKVQSDLKQLPEGSSQKTAVASQMAVIQDRCQTEAWRRVEELAAVADGKGALARDYLAIQEERRQLDAWKADMKKAQDAELAEAEKYKLSWKEQDKSDLESAARRRDKYEKIAKWVSDADAIVELQKTVAKKVLDQVQTARQEEVEAQEEFLRTVQEAQSLVAQFKAQSQARQEQWMKAASEGSSGLLKWAESLALEKPITPIGNQPVVKTATERTDGTFSFGPSQRVQGAAEANGTAEGKLVNGSPSEIPMPAVPEYRMDSPDGEMFPDSPLELTLNGPSSPTKSENHPPSPPETPTHTLAHEIIGLTLTRISCLTSMMEAECTPKRNELAEEIVELQERAWTVEAVAGSKERGSNAVQKMSLHTEGTLEDITKDIAKLSTQLDKVEIGSERHSELIEALSHLKQRQATLQHLRAEFMEVSKRRSSLRIPLNMGPMGRPPPLLC